MYVETPFGVFLFSEMTKEVRKIWHVMPMVLQTPIYVFVRVLFTVFAGLEIEGRQNVYGMRNAIFAANHVTEFDGPLIRSCLPFFSHAWSPMYYVGMKDGGYGEDFGWRRFLYQGEFFKMLGAYPTFPGSRSYKKSLAWFLVILKHHRTLCIFPEGRRNPTGVPSQARGGVGFLTHATKIPVVPVRIKGLENMTLYRLLTFRMKVSVVFGSVFSAKELVSASRPLVEDYRKGGEEIMRVIREL